MNIYTLPDKFTKYGQAFTKIKEGKKAYIYARSDKFGIIAYEVFKKRLKKIPVGSFEWKSDKYGSYDAYEKYPSNESFGKWAKCCMTLERAEFHFDNYEKEQDNGEG